MLDNRREQRYNNGYGTLKNERYGDQFMKTFTKRAVAFLLAVVLSLSLTGCYDENLTWAAKKGDVEMPIGAYIYLMSVAYNEAAAMIDSETKVADATIEGEDAETWIRNRTMEYVNRYFWIEEEMDRLGLELTEEDYSNASSTTSTYWNYYGSAFEGYGIAESSFDLAYSQYNKKYERVFAALYGDGGERDLSDEEIAEHFRSTYYNFEYFTIDLTTTDADGNSVDLTEEEIEELTKTLEDGRVSVLNGSTDTETFAEATALSYGEDSSYTSNIMNVSNMATYYMPDAFIEAVMETAENEIAVFEASGCMVFLHKLPISDMEEEVLADEDNILQLMSELKSEEYKEYVETTANTIEGIEMNESAIKRYKPSMFADSTEYGTSSTAEEETETKESSEEK